MASSQGLASTPVSERSWIPGEAPAARYLKAVLDTIDEGVMVVDRQLNIQALNRAAQEMLGFPESEVLGQFCGEVCRGNLCRTGCPAVLAFGNGRNSHDVEMTIRTKAGLLRVIQANTSVLRDEGGEVVGAVETFRDITEIRELTRRLADRFSFGNIIGKSKPMQELY